MRAKSYLHELSQEEKRKFYAEQLFEGFTNVKIWFFIVAGLITVIDFTINNLLPSPLKTKPSPILLLTRYMSPIAVLIYIISYCRCLRRPGYKFVKIRIALICIAVCLFAGQTCVESIIRPLTALLTKKIADWIPVHLLIIQSIYLIPLISLLSPVWYLEVVLAGAYFLGITLAYVEAKYTMTIWIIVRNIISFIYFISLTAISNRLKHQHFVKRVEAESWNIVYKDIIEKSPFCVAVINMDGSIAYNNPEFNNIVGNRTHQDFFTQLTRLKIRTWLGEPISPDRTLNAKDTDPLVPEADMRSSEDARLNMPDCPNLGKLIDSYRSLLDKNYIQSKDQVSFDGKVGKEGEDSPIVSFEGFLRPIMEHKKIILMLVDTTERNLIAVLESNNQYKDRLLASVSHELRTPLNSNLGFLQSAIYDPNVRSVTKKKFLIPAFRSGKLLCHLINDILDYSQLLNEKVRLTYESRSLKEVIEYCYQLMEYAFSGKGLVFELIIDKTLPLAFRTDHDRLSQILLNLLSNAIKFTMKGGVTVKIESFDEVHAEISVIDTGIGIQKERISKLFEEEDITSTDILAEKEKHSQGVGLGLKIANRLAKLLGFDTKQGIQVVSHESGSKFSFTIKNQSNESETPIASVSTNIFEARQNLRMLRVEKIPTDHFGEDDESPLRNEIEISAKPMKTLTDVRWTFSKGQSPSKFKPVEVKPKVLIVDDDPFNILSLQSLLGQLQISCDSVNNGQKAVDKVISDPWAYQLILMDCQMPVMNGYEATKILTQKMRDEELPRIPIVGCTAFTAKDKLDECINCGMVEVLNKPVMFPRLQELSSKFLR